MAAPLTIEFRNTQPEEAIEFRIRREFAKLEKLYDRFVSCRVDVEAPAHERRSSVFTVRIDFGLRPEDATEWARSGGAVFRQGEEHMEVNAQRKDSALAVHAAFKTARRRLEDFVTSRSRR